MLTMKKWYWGNFFIFLHIFISINANVALFFFFSFGFQVAYALNCPTTSDNELALCLRNRDVDSLLNVKIDKPRYVPAYAPLIDRAVIPKEPLTLMENTQLFGRFEIFIFFFFFFSMNLYLFIFFIKVCTNALHYIHHVLFIW